MGKCLCWRCWIYVIMPLCEFIACELCFTCDSLSDSVLFSHYVYRYMWRDRASVCVGLVWLSLSHSSATESSSAMKWVIWSLGWNNGLSLLWHVDGKVKQGMITCTYTPERPHRTQTQAWRTFTHTLKQIYVLLLEYLYGKCTGKAFIGIKYC